MYTSVVVMRLVLVLRVLMMVCAAMPMLMLAVLMLTCVAVARLLVVHVLLVWLLLLVLAVLLCVLFVRVADGGGVVCAGCDVCGDGAGAVVDVGVAVCVVVCCW